MKQPVNIDHKYVTINYLKILILSEIDFLSKLLCQYRNDLTLRSIQNINKGFIKKNL